MKQKIPIPAHALKALEILESNGFEAWCVGGCVRDSLLGLVPADWDVTTSALPGEIRTCFSSFPIIDTGLKHGTVTAVVDGEPLEITTYRSDGDYKDHRHPENVKFSRNLKDDLSRRDFTINAMAYHPARGLVDEFGGLSDLKGRTLRCVGEPDRRFSEDALRVLRCLRFSSVLGFPIESATARAMERRKALLAHVSPERVQEELTKLLLGKNAGKVLEEHSGVFFAVLPELSSMEGCTQENPYHCYDVWGHTLRTLEAVPEEADLRWAALLHDCGKPAAKTMGLDGTAHFYGHVKESLKLADQILSRLRFSNRGREAILTLVQYHGEVYPVSEKRLKKLLGKLGETAVFQLFQLSKADLAAQSPHLYEERLSHIEESQALAREILSREECLTLRDLAVNGKDLLAMGIPQGPEMGKLLSSLLEEVLEGSLPNERDALLARAGALAEIPQKPIISKEINDGKIK